MKSHFEFLYDTESLLANIEADTEVAQYLRDRGFPVDLVVQGRPMIQEAYAAMRRPESVHGEQLGLTDAVSRDFADLRSDFNMLRTAASRALADRPDLLSILALRRRLGRRAEPPTPATPPADGSPAPVPATPENPKRGKGPKAIARFVTLAMTVVQAVTPPHLSPQSGADSVVRDMLECRVPPLQQAASWTRHAWHLKGNGSQRPGTGLRKPGAGWARRTAPRGSDGSTRSHRTSRSASSRS